MTPWRPSSDIGVALPKTEPRDPRATAGMVSLAPGMTVRRSRRPHPWRALTTVLLLGLVALLAIAPPGVLGAPRKAWTPPGCAEHGAWITLEGTKVVELRWAVGGRDPAATAAEGTAWLSGLASNPLVTPESVVVRDGDVYSYIGIEPPNGDLFQRLLSLDDRAGECFGVSRATLALRYRDQVRAAIRAYRQEHSLSSWLTGSALAALVLTIYLIWIRWQSRLKQRLARAIQTRKSLRISGLGLAGNQLLEEAQVGGLLQGLLTVAHWALLVVVSYLLVPMLLGFFPPTKVMAAGLRSQLLAVVQAGLAQVVAAIPNLLTILLILAITVGTVRLSQGLFRAMGRGRLRFSWFYPEWAEPTARIATALIVLAGCVIAFPYVPGSTSKVFQGAGLFLGVLAALGSSAIATNVISGLMLIYTRAFQEGDRVEIGGVVGVVQERALLVTRLRTPRNELVSVPNATVIATSVTNFSFSRREIAQPVALATTVTIGYDVPWRQVHALLLSAARSVDGISDELAPFVLQTSLNDFHISYELTVFVREVERYRETLSQLLAAVQDAFAAAEVEILSPGYHAIRNGNASTVPKPLQT